MEREWTIPGLKAKLPDGPWQDEPDKVLWRDPETGLFCVARRGAGGNWCGYVGLPIGHPLHGVRYSECGLREKCPGHRSRERVIAEAEEQLANALERGSESEAQSLKLVLEMYRLDSFQPGHEWGRCPGNVDQLVEVHGGVTYSDGSDEPAESFEQWVEACSDPEVQKWWAYRGYPEGATYQEFVDWRDACDLRVDGQESLWWFGFDCAHARDMCPAFGFSNHGIYRTLDYVRSETTKLATQLSWLDHLAILDEVEI